MQIRFRSLCLLLIITTFSTLLASETGNPNPFLKMIGKPYASYMRELQQLRYDMDFVWTRQEADLYINYMQEAEKMAGDKQWEFERRFLEMAYQLRWEKSYTLEQSKQAYTALIKEAVVLTDTITKLRSMYGLMYLSWYFTKDYEEAFNLAKAMERDLSNLTPEQFPEKLYCYRMFGDMHYQFRDYENARLYYNKTIDEYEAASGHHLLQACYNGLALIARYYDNDYGASDRYLYRILALPRHPTASEKHTLSWEGIGHGNLGYNLYLQKRYKEAIPKLEFARKRMEEVDDYSYAGFMAVTLADAYLTLGDKTKCKTYIDCVNDYNHKVGAHSSKNNFYPVLCRYYLSIGDAKLGQQYMDSVIVSQKRAGEEFNLLKLMRAEQRNYKLEQQAKEDELKAEQHRSERYWQMIVTILTGVFLVGIFVVLLILLYFRKRDAFRMLVKKNQKLANTVDSYKEIVEVSAEGEFRNEKSPREVALMEEICQLMEQQKIYTSSDLDLTQLADLLNVGRTSVSNTVNHCMGMTITQYINEYRTNEAIRIMSDPANASLTIDAIAFHVGFNDRKSFYRTFKKNTGLAPSEFRDNITENK